MPRGTPPTRKLVKAGVRDMLRDRGKPWLSWKTGTSYGYRDAWSVGSTPDYSAGVWVGRPDGTPLPGSMGADTALPLLRQILLAMPRHTPRELPPASVSKVDICWPLGRAAEDTPPELCARRGSALVLDGRVPPTLSAPGESPSWLPLVQIRVDPVTGQRLTLDCAPGSGTLLQRARWPSELGPWLDPALARTQTMPARRADCAAV